MSTDADQLPDDARLLKQMICDQSETIRQSQQRIEQLEHYLEQLLRSKYGPRNERVDPNQLQLFAEDASGAAGGDAQAADDSDDDNGIVVRAHRRRGGGRQSLPDHLPREIVEHDLCEEEKCCPGCGEARQRVGSETSEQLEYVPAVLKVIRHVRFKYACRRCQEHVAVAPPPSKPIDKGDCPDRVC